MVYIDSETVIALAATQIGRIDQHRIDYQRLAVVVFDHFEADRGDLGCGLFVL